MIYLLDENLPKQLAQIAALVDRREGVQIEPLTNHFEPGTADEAWVRTVSGWRERPAIVSGDGRILRNPKQRLMLREADLTFVVMGEAFMRTGWYEQAWKFVKAWPAIAKAAEGARRPTIFEVAVSSLRVEERHATRDLR